MNTLIALLLVAQSCANGNCSYTYYPRQQQPRQQMYYYYYPQPQPQPQPQPIIDIEAIKAKIRADLIVEFQPVGFKFHD